MLLHFITLGNGNNEISLVVGSWKKKHGHFSQLLDGGGGVPAATLQQQQEESIIFNAMELFDGAGESKDNNGMSPNGFDSERGLSAGEEKENGSRFEEEPKQNFAQPRSLDSLEGKVDVSDEEESSDNENQDEDLIEKGREIFIQGFNWESHKKPWWQTLQEKVPQIAAWGFTIMWLPPFCESLAPQGYLPKNLYNLNSAYGSEGELRSLLKDMKKNKLQPMADIVINHRIGSTRGVGDLYNRYDGMPMPWDEHAVTCDTGGLGQASTGAVFKGVPNLDHTSEVVANDLKNWLLWVLTEVGFTCFRFDYGKGYNAKFVKAYIEASKPRLAIGKYWDTCKYVGPMYVLDFDQDLHRQRIVDWIDGTGALSCAFDFTTKAILQETCAKGEWWRLRDAQGRPPGLMGIWPSRAVTFIENHDTGSTQIRIRKSQDIHSRSTVEILDVNNGVYTACIDDGKLLLRLGDGNWAPSTGHWEVAISGHRYMVWQKPKQLLPA